MRFKIRPHTFNRHRTLAFWNELQEFVGRVPSPEGHPVLYRVHGIGPGLDDEISGRVAQVLIHPSQPVPVVVDDLHVGVLGLVAVEGGLVHQPRLGVGVHQVLLGPHNLFNLLARQVGQVLQLLGHPLAELGLLPAQFFAAALRATVALGRGG